jgi:hypothetical protein
MPFLRWQGQGDFLGEQDSKREMKMLLPAKREGVPQQVVSSGLGGSLQGPGTNQLNAFVQQAANAGCQQSPHRFHVAVFGE